MQLGVWSMMCHRWPSRELSCALARSLWVDLSMLSSRTVAKMLRLVGQDLEPSLCRSLQGKIAYHANLRSQVSQLDHYIFSIFCLRVASILEQCAACLSLSTGRWCLNACLFSAFGTCSSWWGIARKLEDLGCWSYLVIATTKVHNNNFLASVFEERE